MKSKLFLLTTMPMLIMSLPLWPQSPICLRTDSPSTPNSGGEGGNGGYLTIYGKNLGSAGSVTVGGQPVAQILLWTADLNGISSGAIGVQIAAGTPAGAVVVTTSAGSCSNLTWTPRAGKIYYVGATADNTAPPACSTLLAVNSYTAPWGLNSSTATAEGSYSDTSMRTPYTYFNCLSMGDTLVFLDGVKYIGYDGRGWHSSLTNDKSGSSSTDFMTITGRPGATATIGGTSMYGIRDSGGGQYTVVSGLTLVGGSLTAINMTNYYRILGNVMNCPNCSGESGGAGDGSEGSANGVVYDFNAGTDISTGLSAGESNKQYHDAYFAGNNFEFAWNRFYSNKGYNGLQINQDSTSGFCGFSIHDNDIADVNGSGINMATVNPGACAAPTTIYNNIIHHTGIERASDGGEDDYHSAISAPGYQSGSPTGTVEITNNTLYDCSAILSTYGSGENLSGCITTNSSLTGMTFNLENNLIIQPAYTYTSSYNPYFSTTSGTITGKNNLFSSGGTPGATSPAASVTNLPVPTNPGITDAADGSWTNYELTAGSAAVGAGAEDGNTPLLDFTGDTLPNPPAIGALELQGNSPPPPTDYTLAITPPTNGTIGGSTAGSYAAGTALAFTINPASGYKAATVSGCGGALNGSNYAVTMPASNCTVAATFTANATATYALTITPPVNGTIGGSAAGSYAAGTALMFTINPAAGYQIATVTGCGGVLSGSNYAVTMPANACNGAATFTASAATTYAFSVTATPAADGSVAGTAAGSYPQGNSITESATPSSSAFQFSGWSGCATGSAASITFSMTANACVETATFAAVATGTIKSVGSPVCSHNFDNGSGSLQYTPKAIGDTLVIGVSLESATVAVTGISDGHNTYPAPASTEVGNGYTATLYAVLANQSTSLLTIATKYSASVYDTVCISEYSGVVALGTAAKSTGVNTPYSLTLTPHEASNFVVAQITSYGGSNGVATQGKIRAQSNDDVGGLIQDNTGGVSPITVSGTGISNYHWAAAALELRTE